MAQQKNARGGKSKQLKSRADYSDAQWKRLSPNTKRTINAKDKLIEAEKAAKEAAERIERERLQQQKRDAEKQQELEAKINREREEEIQRTKQDVKNLCGAEPPKPNTEEAAAEILRILSRLQSTKRVADCLKLVNMNVIDVERKRAEILARKFKFHSNIMKEMEENYLRIANGDMILDPSE